VGQDILLLEQIIMQIDSEILHLNQMEGKIEVISVAVLIVL
jgi:hypothetical protein